MSSVNPPITFLEMLERCERVVIPQIQRDYAQGREAEKEVRDTFLAALQGALTLPAESEGVPLNLDFIYGSTGDGSAPSFLPLDGQQRLTTLFLLHWYLAWHDGHLVELRSLLWDGQHSRFSYDVRPSSIEFFDALVQFTPAVHPRQARSVRAILEDQPWYFLYWRLDPTIQSALTMLDAIHRRLCGSAGLYARLVDRARPAITFQVLQLEHFGLSDDLYIKMNARGKPLTAFETFKARFEDLLRTLFPTERVEVENTRLPVAQFFERRMDTQWTDLFWYHKTPGSDTFDDAVMNLVWALVRISLDPSLPSFAEDTAQLRGRQVSASYSSFHDRGWLTRPLAENLICLLEAWSAGGGGLKQQLPAGRYFDETAFFRKAIANPTSLEYSELGQFAAFVEYLRLHERSVEATELQEWMRVAFNLIANSNIERPEEFGRSLLGLRRLAVSARQILQHLAAAEFELQGVSGQQLREEILKAQLLLAHVGWRHRIETAEQHGYFRGQIEFLLEFSGATTHAAKTPVNEWPESLHTGIQAEFDDVLAKAQLTFGPYGLIEFPGQPHLWQRALLTVGDYLIQGSTNSSFGTDSPNNWDSWKRYLRGNPGGGVSARRYLMTLWSRLDANDAVAPQLEKLIADSRGLEPWREAMVKYPQVIDYCGEREIRRREGVPEIYLLKKKQMNGTHAELFSFVLFHRLSAAAGKEKVAPLQVFDYQSVTMTEVEPYIRLGLGIATTTIIFGVRSAVEGFEIFTALAPLANCPGGEVVLKEKLGFVQRGEELRGCTTRADILDRLQHLGAALSHLSL